MVRTLDDVIKIYERGISEVEAYDAVEDALHYLKEYKNTDENYKKAIAHVTEVIDHYEKMVADYLSVNNPALTWDELQQMEGKPIWMEFTYHNPEETYKYWTIVKYFDNDEGGAKMITGTGVYHKCVIGTDWQAYRKERECSLSMK